MPSNPGEPKDTSGHVRSARMMLQDWQSRYADKVRTPEQAVAAVRRGDKAFVGSGAAEPQVLVKALIESAGRLADTRIMHIMTLGVAPYTE